MIEFIACKYKPHLTQIQALVLGRAERAAALRAFAGTVVKYALDAVAAKYVHALENDRVLALGLARATVELFPQLGVFCLQDLPRLWVNNKLTTRHCMSTSSSPPDCTRCLR
jgi:hypothetical protein